MNILDETQVLELTTLGLPRVFSAAELQNIGQKLTTELSDLLNTQKILTTTVLAHRFKLEKDRGGKPCLRILLGLALANQLVLDFSLGSLTLARAEQAILEDRDRLVHAIRKLPADTALATLEASQINAAAMLQIDVDKLRPALSRHLLAILSKQRRVFKGTLLGDEWEHEIPSLPKYEFWPEVYEVRAVLLRRQRGYAMVLLARASLATELQAVRQLRLIERPDDADIASALDRAEFQGDPVELTIKIGTLFGRDELTVANFVALRTHQASAQSKADPFPQSSYAHLKPDAEELAADSAYSRGCSAHRDRRYQEATQLFGEAAAIGDERAWTMLGSMAHSGHGRETDYALAHDCFEKAAAKGFAPAIRALGDMALKGRGQQKDPVEAARMFALADVRGEPRAAASLAMMHMSGQGVPRDPIAARRYAEKAAEAGDALGKALLGSMMCQGIAGSADPVNGFALISEAAPSHPWATYQLGICFEHGLGTSANRDRATAAYRDALNGGISAAKNRLDQLLGP